MKFIEYAEKLETIRYLAQHKRAGSPLHLSQMLQLSERTVQRMVQTLRDYGCPISYNRQRKTYEISGQN